LTHIFNFIIQNVQQAGHFLPDYGAKNGPISTERLYKLNFHHQLFFWTSLNHFKYRNIRCGGTEYPLFHIQFCNSSTCYIPFHWFKSFFLYLVFYFVVISF
jgi:hypothetical protein